jgi:hypothetical protein
MGGLVGSAPVCYGSSQISLKNTKWATLANFAKEWPTRCSPPKKYTKNFKSKKLFSAFNEVKKVFA